MNAWSDYVCGADANNVISMMTMIEHALDEV